jgi:cysteine desulfurase
MNDPVYLDHNASTPVLPRVREAALRALVDGFGNPSAGHPYGRRARAYVEAARAEVAALVGAEPDEIVFTGGGTESDNLALRGHAAAAGAPLLFVRSSVEHPAVEKPLDALVAEGRGEVAELPVDRRGVVRTDALAPLLEGREGRALVTVILAQNETGVLQPVAELARVAKAAGATVHTDAAQAVGKVPVDVRALGVDLLTIAGHKLYAPKGVGALYVRRGAKLAPFAVGAGHERGLRPGTENVASIAALGEACAIAREDLEAEAARQKRLRDRLAAWLQGGGFVVHGDGAPRLPNTLSGRFPGVRGSALLEATPVVAATTGSACHAGVEHASAALLAMGIASEDALGAIRLALGRGTTEAEIDLVASELLVAAASLTAR